MSNFNLSNSTSPFSPVLSDTFITLLNLSTSSNTAPFNLTFSSSLFTFITLILPVSPDPPPPAPWYTTSIPLLVDVSVIPVPLNDIVLVKGDFDLSTTFVLKESTYASSVGDGK